MLITLIHPSRGRAQKALETYWTWLNRSSGDFEIEHILSYDLSDTEKNKYVEHFFGLTRMLLNDNSCVVEATNIAANKAKGDILVYLSDDFSCPQDWDRLIVDRVKGLDKFILRVNDGHQPMDNCVLTIPIMSKSLYGELGYFWNPEYKSMWVDVDLYFTTRKYMIEAPELLFVHEHPVTGVAQDDETYRRSALNWNQGVEIFNRRSKEFGWGRAFNKIP